MSRTASRHADPHTTGLFDAAASWASRAHEAAAFDAFVTSADFVRATRANQHSRLRAKRPMRDSAVVVYRSMFSALRAHLERRGEVALADASPEDLASFFESRARPYARPTLIRYVRLIERIYEHMSVLGVAHRQPAARLAVRLLGDEASSAPKPELPMVTLDAAQQSRLWAQVAKLRSAGRTQLGWRASRDAAMLAVLLGAGLTVAETVALRTRDVGELQPDGTLPIELPAALTAGLMPHHRVALEGFAAATVADWLAVRAPIAGANRAIFLGRDGAGTVDKATLWRVVRAALTAADIDVAHRGGRTLRNSFAARELERGVPAAFVGEQMGLRKRASIVPYQVAARRLGARRPKAQQADSQTLALALDTPGRPG